MEKDPIETIVLGVLFVLGLIALSYILFRNAKLLRNARIQEEDGTSRPPTRKEIFLIAQHIANDKGKHFWHIIIAGIIIIAVVILVMKYVILPRFDL